MKAGGAPPRNARAPGGGAGRDRQAGQRIPTARAGRHFTFPTARRSAAEFAQVAARIAHRYPATRTIHLVVGQPQYSLPKIAYRPLRRGARNVALAAIHRTLHAQARLNQAEIEIGLFSRQCLGRRALPICRRCAPRPAPGPANQSQTDDHQLEFYTPRRTIRLPLPSEPLHSVRESEKPISTSS